MSKYNNNKFLWQFLGIVLVSLGIGVLIGLLIPYCGYLLAIALIILGLWILYYYKC